jgi:hypothetical protein
LKSFVEMSRSQRRETGEMGINILRDFPGVFHIDMEDDEKLIETVTGI